LDINDDIYLYLIMLKGPSGRGLDYEKLLANIPSN